MKKRGVAEWIQQPKVRETLIYFSVPRTPRKAEKELGIKKLKMKPFLKKGILECLNPEARKSRYYVLTNMGRRFLNLPVSRKERGKDWPILGWVMASQRQRSVVLQTIAMDLSKRTSEEIRRRASRLNPHLTRMSTKTILNERITKGLVETEMNGVYRNYWLSEKGKTIARALAHNSDVF